MFFYIIFFHREKNFYLQGGKFIISCLDIEEKIDWCKKKKNNHSLEKRKEGKKTITKLTFPLEPKLLRYFHRYNRYFQSNELAIFPWDKSIKRKTNPIKRSISNKKATDFFPDPQTFLDIRSRPDIICTPYIL